MAETRAFLEAVGRYGATKQQLRARAVSLKPLDDALRRGWVEPHQYPELSGCYYRLTDEGLALLRRRTSEGRG